MMTTPQKPTGPSDPTEVENKKYQDELTDERNKLRNGPPIPHTIHLIDKELQRIREGGSAKDDQATQGKPTAKPPFMEVHKERPTRLQARILIPFREHPNFNFVGKLLGPKGNSLKRLQTETQTSMAILGRGSMWDKGKEEELRNSGEARYAHLHDDLHVEITAYAPPPEAYARMAHALSEVKRYLVPEYFDDIYQKQVHELETLGGDQIEGPIGRPGGMVPPPEGPTGMTPGNRLPPPGARPMPDAMGRFGPGGERPGMRSFFPPPMPPGPQRLSATPRPPVRPPSSTSSTTTTPGLRAPGALGYRSMATDSESYGPMSRTADESYRSTGPANQYAATGEADYTEYGDTYEEGYADNGYNEEDYGGDTWAHPTGSAADRMKAMPPSRGMARASFRGHPYASFGTSTF